MSKQLLYHLNGNKHGTFLRYLDDFMGEPRIAWYFSAGHDFRPLLYLSPQFSERSKPEGGTDPAPPDIFLFTDYFPWEEFDFPDTPGIYLDDRTEVIINNVEELPPLNMHLDAEIVNLPEGGPATGRILFMEVTVNSTVLGKISCRVVYAFAENESFCAEKVLMHHGIISHIIHVRYGGGCGGGGKASGIWINNVLSRLRSEVLITDDHGEMQSGDKSAQRLYPILAPGGDPPEFKTVRVVKSEAWSNHGDVSWKLISHRE